MFLGNFIFLSIFDFGLKHYLLQSRCGAGVLIWIFLSGIAASPYKGPL